jgi:hypothetical protein
MEQCVFGGVKRHSGRTFFTPVPDRSAETLVAVIRDWIRPGTTVISDCWGGGGGTTVSKRKVTRISLTVNHSIGFVDPATCAHTNTIECQWRHLKAYNRRDDYIY